VASLRVSSYSINHTLPPLADLTLESSATHNAPSEPPDLMTIESPIGPLQFAYIPQGWTDAIATATLDLSSKPPNLMTIKSPFSRLQFTHIPQGWTDTIATDPLLVPNVLRTPCPFLDDNATPVTHEHDCEDLTDNKPHGTQADAL